MAEVAHQDYDPAVPIDTLSEHPDNPRRGDEAGIEASIDAHGFYGAVIAQRSTGHIIAGNHRHRAMRQTGAETIPVIWLDVDDDEALRILLNDNVTSDRGSYHDDTLLEMLRRLSASDRGLAGTGFGDADLGALIAQLDPSPQPDDAAPALDHGPPHECPYCAARWYDTAGGLVRLDDG